MAQCPSECASRAEGETVAQEEAETDWSVFGHFTETVPFAKGEFRLCYKSEITRDYDGLKKGQKVVAKSWIKGHAMDVGSWADHLKCERELEQLASDWNKLDLSGYTYETVTSVEGRSETKIGDGSVLRNEFILIEPFLEGNWTKWNSNTSTHASHFACCVQAFCHWSYHQSDGRFETASIYFTHRITCSRRCQQSTVFGFVLMDGWMNELTESCSATRRVCSAMIS